MPWYDLPTEQLKDYRTGTQEPADLDRWWQRRLEEARAVADEPALTRYEAVSYAPLEVYDTGQAVPGHTSSASSGSSSGWVSRAGFLGLGFSGWVSRAGFLGLGFSGWVSRAGLSRR